MSACICVLIIFLLVNTSATSSPQPLCPEGGCKNFTVYLGPRWGSRVFIFPEHHEVSENEPRDEEPAIEIQFRDEGVNVDRQNPSVKFISHKPVIEGDRIRVEDEDERTPRYYRTVPTSNPWDQTTPGPITHRSSVPNWMLPRRPSTPHHPWTTTTSPITHRVGQPPLWERGSGIFNLTGQGLSGVDVKSSLSSLSSEDTKHLRRLHLSGNDIHYLEPLIFPVELEYNLLELRLDDNPLTVLNSYTRFELSRLGYLTSLGLARTGLRYLEPLYIPSLQELDLRGNRLTSLQSLDSLPNLKKLFLDGNRITGLYDFQLTSLRFLSLAGNGLTYISDDAIMSLSQVQIVRLNNNSLDMIEGISKYFYTTDLYLSDNPWPCSCPLVTLAQNTNPRIVDKDTLTCLDNDHEYPRLVTQLSLRDVHLGCPSRWSWLMSRGRDEGEHLVWWLRTRVLRLPTLVIGLGWLLFILAVVLRVRRSKGKVAPSDVPYNVLDDTQVA